MPLNYVGRIVRSAITITRSSPIRSRILSLSGNKENPPHFKTCILWQWLLMTAIRNVTINTTMQGRQIKRSLSLTLRSKKKLLPLFLPQPSRIKQTHLWWSHPPRLPPQNYLYSLLPRNNLILYRQTSLPSWPAIASWLVMSVKSISKTTCASIVVQETTSWTLVPRSKPWSLPKAAVLQQLLIF